DTRWRCYRVSIQEGDIAISEHALQDSNHALDGDEDAQEESQKNLRYDKFSKKSMGFGEKNQYFGGLEGFRYKSCNFLRFWGAKTAPNFAYAKSLYLI
ncbi:hypothetical protein T310_10036, partial [Rasamsonia emersonii CBS 393.64]